MGTDVNPNLQLPLTIGQKAKAASLAVTLASDEDALAITGTVTASGTVTANAGTNLNTSALALEAGGNLAAQTTALQIMDDWDETDRAKVNIIAGQVGVAGGTGTDSALTQRVTLATNVGLPAGTANIGDVDVLTVPADPFGANADAAVAAGATGSIQAKLRRATQGLEDLKTGIILAAGSAAIGKLAANSGVDIGDVDVTSLPALAAGANNIGDVDVLTTVLPVGAVTGTTTAVNDTASSTTLLSSSATRKGFRIWNDSTSSLYLKYGTTASITDCHVKIPPDGYYEENSYYGRVDGIWSVDASGAARIVELT